MLHITIPCHDLPALNADGCNVRINGETTVVRRRGDYLLYGENRCRLLGAFRDSETAEFFAASHGEENEPHHIIHFDGSPTGAGKSQKKTPGGAT